MFLCVPVFASICVYVHMCAWVCACVCLIYMYMVGVCLCACVQMWVGGAVLGVCWPPKELMLSLACHFGSGNNHITSIRKPSPRDSLLVDSSLLSALFPELQIGKKKKKHYRQLKTGKISGPSGGNREQSGMTEGNPGPHGGLGIFGLSSLC